MDRRGRVHGADQLLALSVRCVRQEPIAHRRGEAVQRLAAVERSERGSDRFAAQPERRALVAEQPAVAADDHGDPMLFDAGRNGPGPRDQHRPAGGRGPGCEGHLAVADRVLRTVQAQPRPLAVEQLAELRVGHLADPGHADHAVAHRSRVDVAQRGARGFGDLPHRFVGRVRIRVSPGRFAAAQHSPGQVAD